MKKSELCRIINEEIQRVGFEPTTRSLLLMEDDYKKLTGSVTNMVQKLTASAVAHNFGSAIRDAYDDGKISKSYVKQMITALVAVQKSLTKALSK